MRRETYRQDLGEFHDKPSSLTPTSKSVSIHTRFVPIGWLMPAFTGLGDFVMKPEALPGWMALALCVVAVWIYLVDLQGIVITSDTCLSCSPPSLVADLILRRSQVSLD
jgi:hypothetical protein